MKAEGMGVPNEIAPKFDKLKKRFGKTVEKTATIMKNSLKSAELLFVRKRFDEIQPHPKNPRLHDDRQIGKLRHSIRTHGFAKGSIVIQKSTNYILAGHGIVEALKLEGYNGADVVEVDLPDDKAMAFMIADNHIAEQSTWDDPSLQQLITQLSEQNVPSLDFGFDSQDLEELASRILKSNKYNETKELKSFFQITIDCQNEEEQQSVYNELTNQGYKCKVLTL